MNQTTPHFPWLGPQRPKRRGCCRRRSGGIARERKEGRGLGFRVWCLGFRVRAPAVASTLYNHLPAENLINQHYYYYPKPKCLTLGPLDPTARIEKEVALWNTPTRFESRASAESPKP